MLLSEAGAPVATVLNVTSANLAIVSALSQPDSDTEDLRSFNTFGRPIPPLLRLVKEPPSASLVGTTDVLRSVIQIRPLTGLAYASLIPNAGGPVALLGANVTVQSATPLDGLRSTVDLVASAADESLLGDLNADGDALDLVPEITEMGTGATTDTGLAVTESGSEAVPAIVTEGSRMAMLQSEARSNQAVLNGDGDYFDDLLRIFDFQPGAPGSFVETTGGANLALDPTPVVDTGPGRARRAIGLSGGLVFGLQNEAATGTRTTERVNLTEAGAEQPGVRGTAHLCRGEWGRTLCGVHQQLRPPGRARPELQHHRRLRARPGGVHDPPGQQDGRRRPLPFHGGYSGGFLRGRKPDCTRGFRRCFSGLRDHCQHRHRSVSEHPDRFGGCRRRAHRRRRERRPQLERGGTPPCSPLPSRHR